MCIHQVVARLPQKLKAMVFFWNFSWFHWHFKGHSIRKTTKSLDFSLWRQTVRFPQIALFWRKVCYVVADGTVQLCGRFVCFGFSYIIIILPTKHMSGKKSYLSNSRKSWQKMIYFVLSVKNLETKSFLQKFSQILCRTGDIWDCIFLTLSIWIQRCVRKTKCGSIVYIKAERVLCNTCCSGWMFLKVLRRRVWFGKKLQLY